MTTHGFGPMEIDWDNRDVTPMEIDQGDRDVLQQQNPVITFLVRNGVPVLIFVQDAAGNDLQGVERIAAIREFFGFR